MGSRIRRTCQTLRAALFCRRGAAAVGFTLSLPVLMLIIGGIIEMSRLMYANSTLKFAVQETARAAIVRGAASGNPITQDQITELVRARSVSLDPNGIGVLVNYTPDNRPGSTLTIQAAYRFDFVVPLLDGINGINLTQTASMVVAN